MHYAAYELTDYLEDPYFKEWVYEPTAESEDFWKEFLFDYPEKSEILANAKNILLLLSYDTSDHFPDHDQVSNMWDKIQVGKARSVNPLWPRLLMLTAAAAVIILVTGILIEPVPKKYEITYQNLVSSSKSKLIERKNLTNQAITLNLPDNSQIILEPRSAVSYPEDFNSKKERKVMLSGEAFFKVQKDPERPFYVYANELVTKVLGTSFTVKAFDDSQQVEVVVKTGKVSVFTCQGHKNDTDLRNVTILTPNQKVLYSRKAESLNKFLVDAPEIISSAIAPPIMDFQDTPVSKIFNNLKESYGIDIVYDEKLLGNCLLTASFSQESLYEKIDLICLGIEAEFALVDARIIVSGKGCD